MEQDQYSSNLQVSDVHARLHGRDAKISGNVRNTGASTVTALSVKVRLVGRAGETVQSRDFDIILAGSSPVPQGVAQPLKPGEVRTFDATLTGIPRSWLPGRVAIDLTSVKVAGDADSSSPDTTQTTALAVAILAILVAIVAAGIVASNNRHKKIQAALAAQREWAEAAIEKLEASGGDPSKLPDLSAEVRGLILHAGERCFAACRGVQHVVEGHRTKYVGASQGVSIRITKGVRYHVGGFSGRPVTTTFEKVNDVGDVEARKTTCG